MCVQVRPCHIYGVMSLSECKGFQCRACMVQYSSVLYHASSGRGSLIFGQVLSHLDDDVTPYTWHNLQTTEPWPTSFTSIQAHLLLLFIRPFPCSHLSSTHIRTSAQ